MQERGIACERGGNCARGRDREGLQESERDSRGEISKTNYERTRESVRERERDCQNVRGGLLTRGREIDCVRQHTRERGGNCAREGLWESERERGELRERAIVRDRVSENESK